MNPYQLFLDACHDYVRLNYGFMSCERRIAALHKDGSVKSQYELPLHQSALLDISIKRSSAMKEVKRLADIIAQRDVVKLSLMSGQQFVEFLPEVESRLITPHWLSPADIAVQLGLNRSTVSRWTKEDDFPPSREEGVGLYDLAAVEVWARRKGKRLGN